MEKVCGWHLERQSILLDIHASSWWSFTLVGRKAMSSLSPGHPEQGSAREAWRWIAETQMQCQEVPNLHQHTSWASSFCWKPGRSHPFGNPGSSTPAPFESRSPCCCSPASTCEPQSHWRHGEATLSTTPILGIAARKIDPLWCRPGMGWCRSWRGHFWQEGDQQASAMGTVVRVSPERKTKHIGTPSLASSLSPASSTWSRCNSESRMAAPCEKVAGGPPCGIAHCFGEELLHSCAWRASRQGCSQEATCQNSWQV